MSHEAFRPETYHRPEGGLFNVAAMSDVQISEIYAALDKNLEEGDTGPERYQDSERLLQLFQADVRGMGSSDPGRLRGLIATCVQGSYGSDYRLAAHVTESLIDYDYVFTRDTLVDLTTGYHPIDGTHGSHAIAHDAGELAHYAIARLMRDRLSPEQASDFNAIIVSRLQPPIESADPEEREL
jgi:hypothetical protein